MLFAKTVVSAGPPSPFIARSISLFVQGERGASCHFCYSKFQILQCLTASNGGFSGIGAHPSFMKRLPTLADAANDPFREWTPPLVLAMLLAAAPCMAIGRHPGGLSLISLFCFLRFLQKQNMQANVIAIMRTEATPAPISTQRIQDFE
ncbi:hypothetical protein OIU77_008571 [Salix suchowensis]|uniref:Uncharacterized protein n=1 Tax=Salix suchowensis TaxID=1278906 RepID=A0ABQ9ACJ4_9ROSI|nr:hypothetical protein OIU77_008571 [Salix suchowensis]